MGCDNEAAGRGAKRWLRTEPRRTARCWWSPPLGALPRCSQVPSCCRLCCELWGATPRGGSSLTREWRDESQGGNRRQSDAASKSRQACQRETTTAHRCITGCFGKTRSRLSPHKLLASAGCTPPVRELDPMPVQGTQGRPLQPAARTVGIARASHRGGWHPGQKRGRARRKTGRKRPSPSLALALDDGVYPDSLGRGWLQPHSARNRSPGGHHASTGIGSGAA